MSQIIMRKISITEQEKSNEKNEIINLTESMYVGEYQDYGKFLVAQPVFIHRKATSFTEKEVLEFYGEIPKYWEFDCRCSTGFENGKFGLYRHNGFTNKGPAFYPITELPKIIGIKLKEGKKKEDFLDELIRLEVVA